MVARQIKGRILTRGDCQRAGCGKPFQYFRRTKRRLYCDACTILERRDATRFSNDQARAARIERHLDHARHISGD